MRSFGLPIALASGLLAVTAFFAGCGNTKTAEGEGGDKKEAAHSDDDGHDHGKGESGHVHGEWWCGEHGVPEDVCALCNSKVAAEFQKKGDWCDEHNRPDSQCFVCHPEYKAKFAAQYEAKYGKEPPPMENEG